MGRRSGLIVALGLIGACGNPEIDYLYTLTAASSEPAEGGPMRISPVPRGGSAEDSLFRIDIDVKAGHIEVGILNKTSETAYLIWDQSAYVGPTGEASQLVGGETRNLNVGLSQPSMVVPAGSIANLAVIPAGRIHDGRVVPFFYSYDDRKRARGSSMKLLLPIRIDEKTIEYTLTSVISEVPWGPPP